MTTATTENPCADCTRAARIVTILGTEIRMPYCDECGDRRHREEEAAERARSLEHATRRAGATPRLLTQTLETHPNRDAVAKAEVWIASYAAGTRRNLLLTGEVGLGKTGLAWSIVHAVTVTAVEKFWATDEVWRGLEPPAQALLIRWADLLEDLKDAFDRDRTAAAGEVGDPSELLERAKRIPILALDDVGRERPTPYAISKLANLVESRYQRQAPTIVTSNYRTADLAARLGGDFDGVRIVDRLRDGAVGIAFVGQSLRHPA